MRSQIIGLVAAAGISVSGCATSNGGRPNIEQIVAQTQSIAVQVCSFLPTAETIIEIFSLNNPSLMTASTIANAICSVVVPEARQARRGAPPKVATVGGVVVRGKFVN